jgi:4-hydroxybenzoyl-CoA thioesterase
VFVFRRPVRFAEVDAAGLVFFPRYHEYCHDALEAFFGELPGGYAALFRQRDLGGPTVHLETDFRSPLRFGDVARFDITIERVGRTSLTFHHAIHRESDGIVAATVRQVVVMTQISTLTPIPVPDDIRALLEKYRDSPQTVGGGWSSEGGARKG